MLKRATVREFEGNALAVLRRVERGARILVTRNAKPIALLSPVPPDADLEDLILASHPYFLNQYEKARRTPGIALEDVKRSLHVPPSHRGKRAGPKAGQKA